MTTQDLIYTVAINGGAEVECEALGLAPLQLSEKSGDVSALSLFQARSPDEELALQRGQSVRFFVNGRCIFAGTVLDPRHGYREGSQGTNYILQNWWRDLVLMPFTISPYPYTPNGGTVTTIDGPRIVGDADDPGTTPPTITSSKVLSAKTHLFPLVGVLPGLPTSIQEQLERLFLYISARMPTLITAPSSIAFGGTYFPAPRLVEDIYVADAFRQALALFPSASFSTDYSTPVPVVSCFDSLTLTPRTWPLGIYPLRSLDVTAQRDLVPAAVIIRRGTSYWMDDFLPGFQPLSGGGKYPGGFRQDSQNVVNLSLDSGAQTDGYYASMGSLARQVYEQLAVVRGVGTAVFDDPGLELGVTPGQRLAFTGDKAEHGELIVQEVQHDFSGCTTTAVVGYPRALGLQEIRDRSGVLHAGIWGTAFKRRFEPFFGDL